MKIYSQTDRHCYQGVIQNVPELDADELSYLQGCVLRSYRTPDNQHRCPFRDSILTYFPKTQTLVFRAQRGLFQGKGAGYEPVREVARIIVKVIEDNRIPIEPHRNTPGASTIHGANGRPYEMCF